MQKALKILPKKPVKINEFRKVAGYKTNTQKCVVIYTNNEQFQKEIKKINPTYNNIKKNKILRNKFSQGDERLLH